MTEKFKIGDLVRLKSGGPTMTVQGTSEWSYKAEEIGNATKVTVNWFPQKGNSGYDEQWGESARNQSFHQDQLEIVG